MDDPSNNYKLPPIIIGSPRSSGTVSFDQNTKEKTNQAGQIPINLHRGNSKYKRNGKDSVDFPGVIDKEGSIYLTHLENDKNWSPTVLVLGPGGMKGFLELGALAKLEEQHVLDNVGIYFGVSVGSVICLLRTINYTYREIAELGSGLNLFSGWDDINFAKILQQNGVVPHDKLREFLSEIVRTKLGIIPTFQQLYTMTGYVLRVVSYNITTKTTYYFDYRTHPDASVIEVVLASSTIPLLFYKSKYRGDYYCDGAIGNPYPIDKVDDGATDILGIYISSIPDENNQNGLRWYLDRIIQATMTEYRKHIIKNSSARCKHLVLYSDIKDVTGMTVNNEMRISMFKSGYIAASNFLNLVDDTIIIESRANKPIPYVPSSINGYSENLNTIPNHIDGKSFSQVRGLSSVPDLLGNSFKAKSRNSSQLGIWNLYAPNAEINQPRVIPNLSTNSQYYPNQNPSAASDNLNMINRVISKFFGKNLSEIQRASIRPPKSTNKTSQISSKVPISNSELFFNSNIRTNGYRADNSKIAPDRFPRTDGEASVRGRSISVDFQSNIIREIENRMIRKLVPLIVSEVVKHPLHQNTNNRRSRIKELSESPILESPDQLTESPKEISKLAYLISSVNIIPPTGIN